MRELFGTDGIRGIANIHPITPEFMMRIGNITGNFCKHAGNYAIVGNDSRMSSSMLSCAISSGLMSSGMNVINIGTVSTPMISFAVQHFKAACGIMISASHNAKQYNGIKFFNQNGHKFSIQEEAALSHFELAQWNGIGQTSQQSILDVYLEFLVSRFHNLKSANMRIHIPQDGFPSSQIMQHTMKMLGVNISEIEYDLKIQFDYDGDRVLIYDAQGHIDGDQLIAALGREYDNIVVTEISSGNLENHLSTKKIIRVPVGEKHVIHKMLQEDIRMGGEKSGHIIFTDYSSSSDAVITALKILELVQHNDIGILRSFSPMPRISLDIPYNGQKYQDIAPILQDDERCIIRKSGTEPVIRVLIEGQNQDRLATILEYVQNHASMH